MRTTFLSGDRVDRWRLVSVVVLVVGLGCLVAACTGDATTTETQAVTTTQAVTKPGPADQQRPALKEYRLAMAMDTQSGRVVAFDSSRTTWTFDVYTNTWQAMKPAREPDLGERGTRLAYCAAADVIIAFPSGWANPWTYPVEANRWTQMPATTSSPTITPNRSDDLVYDPISGSVLVRNASTTELWAYAVETNTWTKVDQGGNVPTENPDQLPGAGPHFHSLLSYDAVADRLVLTLLGDPVPQSRSTPFDNSLGGQTWTFDPRAHVWVKKDAIPPRLSTGYWESNGEVAFDVAHGRTVIFSDGRLAAYDAVADDWTVMRPGPGWPSGEDYRPLTGPLARQGHQLLYDPTYERILMLGGEARTLESEPFWQYLGDVWAYDLSNNAWTELVPAQTQ